ncbi:MAG: NAD(P)-dependent oxidoreductase [Chloroflexota bacterium]|nr:NAD(P)-dependent oxidoreductase [Chloroflexota bacterium]
MAETYLVTGGMGCIGAWALYHLQRSGKRAVNFDQSADRQRIDWLMSAEEQAAITFVGGDLRDTDALKSVFAEHGVTRVIHLAALQVPFCRADPVLGAEVNVTGTVNVFEAARANGVDHIAYASSIGVYGPPSDFPAGLIPHDAPKRPRTLYGAYKVCNEGTALVYHEENGITSTGLRPYTVYGVGRNQGMTSEPTKALVAAAKGQPYHIPFSGTMQFQLASDVARQFILAAEQPLDGACGFNLGGGDPVTVADFVAAAKLVLPEAEIEVADNPLPFPAGFDDSALRASFDTVYETPLEEGVAETIAHIQRLGDRI